MNNIIILFCEGAHEPPYIYRVLKTSGWRNKTDQPLNIYPEIVSGYLRSQLSQLDNLSNSDQWRNSGSFLPRYILGNSGNPLSQLILIFPIGGESNYQKAIECMNGFKTASNAEFNAEENQLSIGFLYDADQSIESRVRLFKTKIEEHLPSFANELRNFSAFYLQNSVEEGYHKIGLFVFHDDEGKGALEEHLVPLMQEGNEDIFNDANEFIDNNFDANRSNKGRDKVLNKGLIGVAGQLQRAGRNNTVVIAECDYITTEKVNNFLPAQKLIEFVDSLL